MVNVEIKLCTNLHWEKSSASLSHRFGLNANFAGETIEPPPQKRVLQHQRAERPLRGEHDGHPGRRQVGPLEDVGHGLVEVGQPRVEVELRAAAAATATVAAGPPLRRRPRGDQVRDVHRVADGADVIAEKGTSIGAALLSNPYLYFRLSLLLLFRRQCVYLQACCLQVHKSNLTRH